MCNLIKITYLQVFVFDGQSKCSPSQSIDAVHIDLVKVVDDALDIVDVSKLRGVQEFFFDVHELLQA